MKLRTGFSVKMPGQKVVKKKYRAREHRARGNLVLYHLVGKQRK